MLTMTFSDQEIISRFPVGYYPLHPNAVLNFQLNRFWEWVGEEQMLAELRAAAPRIASFADWAQEMLELSDKALADSRSLPAAYYARMAQFFLDPDDPRYQPALQRFLDNVLPGFGVTPDDHHMDPYQPARIALGGRSMGGGLAPRAAAFDPRIGALVCIDGIYDIGQSYTEKLGLGADTERRLTAESDPELDAMAEQMMHTSSQVRWACRQGMWSFGVATPRAFLAASLAYTLRGGIAEKIT